MPASRRPTRPLVPKGGTKGGAARVEPESPEEDDELIVPPAMNGDADDLVLGPDSEDDEQLDLREDGGTDDANAADLDIGDFAGEEPTAPPSERALALEDDDAEPTLFEDIGGEAAEEAGEGPELAMDAFDDALPASPDDGGAEGMTDGTEGDVDESALPELDADAEGEVDLEDMLRQLGFGGGGAEPWEPQPDLSFDRPLAAVATHDGSVAAVGHALVVIGNGDVASRARPLSEPAVACAWLGPRTVVATERGIHFVAAATREELVVPIHGARYVAVAAGRVWALAASSLFHIDERAGSATPLRDDVRSIAAAAGTLYVLTAGEARLLALRGQDGDFAELSVPADVLEHLDRGADLLVSAAGLVAAIDATTIFVARSKLELVRLEGGACATFCGERADAPLLVASESGALTLYDQTGNATEVGSVPWTPRAIAWDATRDIAFVAGDGGLVALGPRVRH